MEVNLALCSIKLEITGYTPSVSLRHHHFKFIPQQGNISPDFFFHCKKYGSSGVQTLEPLILGPALIPLDYLYFMGFVIIAKNITF